MNEKTFEISGTGDEWLRDYMLLALRLQKAIKADQPAELLDYFGPAEWREQVEREPVADPARLLDDVAALQGTLAEHGFEPQRTRFLEMHLRAFATVARRLRGERLTLQEEVAGCFDLRVDWLPETLFERAYELYDRALPGRGSLVERLHQWRAQMTLPSEKSQLLEEFMRRALAHARQLAHALIPLPADEQVEIAPVFDRPVWGLADYQGNHRSRILINPKIPFPLTHLFYVLCHEGYPGHLAEIVLKEEALVKGRGYLEQQVHFLLTPAFVISEGLALLAHAVLFDPSEEERWLAEHVYLEAGVEPEPCDLISIFRAQDLLRGVHCNAAFMLREGRSEQEVLAYLKRYGLLDDQGAHSELAVLQRKYYEAYTFTYFHGFRLLEARLLGPQKQKEMRRLLTHQVLPSDLEDESRAA